MKIADRQFRKALLQPLLHSRAQGLIHFSIQQNAASFPQQANRPDGYQYRTDNTHNRIQPVGTPKFASGEGDNSQHRSEGVGQHMNVGGAQVQVAVLMLMVVVMVVVPMMMVMVIFQQPGAGQIDQQPQYSHPNGLIVLNGGRGQQTLNRLHQ